MTERLCTYERAGVGRCQRPAEKASYYCKHHQQVTCWPCIAEGRENVQATHECEVTTKKARCGAPLCEEHKSCRYHSNSG